MSALNSAAYDAEHNLAATGTSGGTDAPVAAVPSPCIDICKIDGESGLCNGCLRTRDEIRGWKNMTDDLRLLLIEALSQRKANRQAPRNDASGV
jgi:predicted Fe-S protein YdhL (DUF1289 family)